MNRVQNFDYFGPLLAGVSLATFSRLCYLWLLPKPIPDIPHDPGFTILGHVIDLARFSRDGENDASKWFNGVTARYGPLSQVLIGHARLVIVADRAEAERLLLRAKTVEQSRWVRESFGTVIPTGQLALPTSQFFLEYFVLKYNQVAEYQDDMWRRHRQLMGPSMSRRYLERMSARVSTGANKLVRLWNRKVDLIGSNAFSADQDLKIAVMDVMLSIATGDFSSSVDIAYSSLPAPDSSIYADQGIVHIPQAGSSSLQMALSTLMQSVERLNSTLLPACISKIFVQDLSVPWRQSWRIVSEFIDSKIAEARAREKQQPGYKQGAQLATDADCVVDMIAQRESREDADEFDIGELRDELITFTVAGQDTTGVVLSWIVKFLPQDMELQRQLYNEVCGVFSLRSDEEPWDFDTITDPERMPTLEAVVAESLRCARAVPNTMRELIDDEVILGRHVPKGTMLMFPVGPLSAQESDWGSDAEEWRPSRWLRADGSFNVNAGPSFPFGIGQRACSGQRLAILELKIFVAALSKAFIFKPVPAAVAGCEAFTKISRQPERCYVSLERWPTD